MGGRAVDVINLDFSKTFNAISHDIIIRKLRQIQSRRMYCNIDT